MARGRPHGRSKSDHRVCQAARHARAAEYTERINISAEQQAARIAATNSECTVEDAPHRRRGQKSRGLKNEAWAARGSAHGRSCKASGRSKKKANERLALEKPANRDPHTLHCHECGATAEFALRGSKEGGAVKYFCARHLNSNGRFRVDRDRAAWAQNRVEQWRLKAEVARLEEELRQMGGASPAAEQTEESTWIESWQDAVHLDLTPKSSSLIAKLLIIGGIEKNPGPAPVPDAAVSKDKGDPVDKGETMPKRAASFGGLLIAVPPWEEVYNTRARSSEVQRVCLFEQWRTERRLTEQVQVSWCLTPFIMARGRPHGRSESDHRVCQAAKRARAAEYRDRISISDEQQEARIAAVNAECSVEDAPHRFRGQRSCGSKNDARAARRPAHRRSCKASSSAKKKANQRLAQSLEKAAEKDPYCLHCHECGGSAEFRLRGSKGGGAVQYFCEGHHPGGCFQIDKDRAAWVQGRIVRRMKFKLAMLEEVLRQTDEAPPAGEGTCDQSAWSGLWEGAVFCNAAPMSKALIGTLLAIGCIESNPGPAPAPEGASDGGNSATRSEPTPQSIGSARRPLIALPSLQEVYEGSWPLADRVVPGSFEVWMKEKRLSEQVPPRDAHAQADQTPPAAASKGPEVTGTESLAARSTATACHEPLIGGAESSLVTPPEGVHSAEENAGGSAGEFGGVTRDVAVGDLSRRRLRTSEEGSGDEGACPQRLRVSQQAAQAQADRTPPETLSKGSNGCGTESPPAQSPATVPNETSCGETEPRASCDCPFLPVTVLQEAHEQAIPMSLEGAQTPPEAASKGPEETATASHGPEARSTDAAAVAACHEPLGGDTGQVEQQQSGDLAPTSAEPAQKKGQLSRKKRSKREKPAPAPVDETTRAAAAADLASMRTSLAALQSTRVCARSTREEPEHALQHQTQLHDFTGPLRASPLALVTKAPISNVGELEQRLQAKRDADAAEARAKRQKLYGQERPLGYHTVVAAASKTDQPRPAPKSPPPAHTAEPPGASPPPITQQAGPQEFPPVGPTSQPSADADADAGGRLGAPAACPPTVGEQPVSAELPPMHGDQPPVLEPLLAAVDPSSVQNQPPAATDPPPVASDHPSSVETAAVSDEPLGEPAPVENEPPALVESDAPVSGADWCSKLATALQQKRANGHAIVAAEDVNAAGAKRWASFKDVEALVAYRRPLSSPAFLNEVIQDDACWRPYFDLDYQVAVEDPDDFNRRLGHFHRVRDRFLATVLNIPQGTARFQVCEAHGPIRSPGVGVKYSVHEVLEGFHLRGLQARRGFGKAFGCFLDSPPDDLKRSVELLRKEGGSGYMWDASVYSRNRCFRMLRSSKFADPFRRLVPSEGSSPQIADHLVCLYSAAELAGSTEIDGGLLDEWAAAESAAPTPASREGAFRQKALIVDPAASSDGSEEGLSVQEQRILLDRYREDHPGAEIDRVLQERPGLFFVHFRAPEPMCCIAGRRHTSPGNQNPYLIFKRDEARVARYQCFANDCRGECRVLPLNTHTILGWTEDYEEHTRMRPYPVFQLSARVRKRTILVSAKKGVGKSKAFIEWLIAMVKKNPGVSFLLIGANISLSRKYHQDLVDAGIEGVVLYLEAPPGPIKDSRVVCCINSIHRVRPGMDVVGMDEMDMVLTNLNSEVMARRGQVLSCLEADVASARVVIGMDANIDCARVMEYLFMVRPDGVLHTIRNRGLYPAARHATIRIFPPESSMLACVDTAARDVLDRVARGTKVVSPSTSKRYVKHVEYFFNEENKPAESDRRGVFLHADKKSKEDEDFFQQAMAEPDKYLEADLVAFSPKLGPGVSKERPYAEETVAFALNSLNGPTVETLLQQHARFRTVTCSTVYYKQVITPAVDLPRTTEDVFLAIERNDKQLGRMLGDVACLNFLKGSRGVCDRSSASCVLYANNILAKVDSYLQYVPKLRADLEKQGYVITIEHVDPKVGGSTPSEIPLGFDEGDMCLDVEDWREKYVIDPKKYEELVERSEDAKEDLSKREELQKYLYEMVRDFYKVDPNRVDHAFYDQYCADTEEAKATKDEYTNYLRFRESRFDSLALGLERALGDADREGVTQEYVKEVCKPENRVPFAVRVLAYLMGCSEAGLDREAERWEVAEETVQAAYAQHIGVSQNRLKTICTMYNFVQQTTRASQSKEGKVNHHWSQKRNTVKNVLKTGLGVGLELSRKSNGKFVRPHVLTPVVWLDLHRRYGTLDIEDRVVELEPECMIVV